LSMTMAKGYSLWAIPSGSMGQNLTHVIEKFAWENSAPRFQPHITILGEILKSESEILEKTEKLTNMFQAFRVSSPQIKQLDTYFRALFLQIKETPEIMQLHANAATLFDMPDVEAYFPNLSLLYGDFSSTQKDEIAQSIDLKFPVSFDIADIQVIKSEGPPEKWRLVRNFPLIRS
jgi:hypothetical protein